jgi:hypothetical protein
MQPSKIVVMAIAFILLSTARGYADHERFTVGEMRNVDPSADIITSVSGKCAPSHDRERLDCYFTSFGLWKARNEEKAKRELDETIDALNKDSAKAVKGLKRLCADKKMTDPDPVRLKYNESLRALNVATKTFCARPSQDSAINLVRALSESDAKRCQCIVSDWRSTFVRQIDRWVAQTAEPGGICGVINIYTLTPHDLKKMKEPVGPVLWRLEQQDVVTRADDPLCEQLNVKSGSMTLSWDAPTKSIDCRELDFSSALEGMSEPRKK